MSDSAVLVLMPGAPDVLAAVANLWTDLACDVGEVKFVGIGAAWPLEATSQDEIRAGAETVAEALLMRGVRSVVMTVTMNGGPVWVFDAASGAGGWRAEAP